MRSVGSDDEGRVTVVRAVINYLSLNALMRPLVEIAEFVMCSWPSHVLDIDVADDANPKTSDLTNDSKLSDKEQPVHLTESTSNDKT
eukprot:9806272-Ditylum_brightwellii.AAC.1